MKSAPVTTGNIMHSDPRVLCTSFLAFAVLFAVHSAIHPARAQTYTVLHTFCSQNHCRDGASPRAGALVPDGSGHFIGTTGGGGYRHGTVFRLSPGGTERVLYRFSGKSDGNFPWGGVMIDNSGNLYGTTLDGGGSANCTNGCGTVFKLSPTGSESILYAFQCLTDGCNPVATPIADSAGNLYGTTQGGGTGDGGVVFKVTPDGTETVLHSFSGPDGINPEAGVIMDKSGNLYGTTAYGKYGFGVIFKLAPDGTETTLHAFCPKYPLCADGVSPWASLIADSAGNLYGTTQYGGSIGGGVVFKITPNGHYSVIYNFCQQANCADGAFPSAPVVMDASGNLYGTTQGGGVVGGNGLGVVFEISPGGTETTLYKFCSQNACADGYYPWGPVTLDGAGNLYGTTFFGGNGCCDGDGVAFKITRN